MSARRRKNAPEGDLDYLAQEEVMRRLGVSRQTIWRWRREGRLICIERFGRVRISAASIRALAGE